MTSNFSLSPSILIVISTLGFAIALFLILNNRIEYLLKQHSEEEWYRTFSSLSPFSVFIRDIVAMQWVLSKKFKSLSNKKIVQYAIKQHSRLRLAKALLITSTILLIVSVYSLIYI